MNQPTPRRVLLNELPALVGTTLGRSGSILITQEHIDQFADVTLDRQWLYVDPERAATGPFGSTVAHGHRSLTMVRRYIRDGELFRADNAARGAGL